LRQITLFRAVQLAAILAVAGCGDDSPGSADPVDDAGPPRCEPGPARAIALDDGVDPVRRLPFDPDDEGAPSPMTTSIRRVDVGPGFAATGEHILVTEAEDRDTVTLVHGPCDPLCKATPIPGDYTDPARVAVADWDGDGDRDLLIADIGSLPPSDAQVGRVLLKERIAPDAFARETRVLIENFGRISCAEPGDFDGDGDVDVAVCEFGNLDGSSFWLEQEDGEVVDRRFIDSDMPGTIHLFPFDADGDGDLDLAGAISQLEEAIVLYRNDGTGSFARETLFQSELDYYGTSGIELADMDFDGDLDILHSNGDLLDFDLPLDVDPAALHRLGWLENDGDGGFTDRPIANLYGAYALRATDVDGDCRVDVVAAAFRPTFRDAPDGATYLYHQRADGEFDEQQLGDGLDLVLAMELADLDGDGTREIWTGSLGIEDQDAVERLASQTIGLTPATD